jgi:2-keto-4-pentenoate hydratase
MGERGYHPFTFVRNTLTWLANEVASDAAGLQDGDVLVTGTCVPPRPIAPCARVRMDFGGPGHIERACTSG